MNEKKNHFIMKNKKKKFYGTEAKGYCPFEQAGGARRWAAWALGRWAARAQARGALERAGARQGARAAGARTEGRAGRARQQARALAERAGQDRLGGRRAAWALGARPGRLGWPWAVHSVHSAHFRSVLTRFFFPESPNEHCSL